MATRDLTLPAPHSDALDLPLKSALARAAHGISPASLAMAHADWLTHLLVSPSKQAELGSSALHKWLDWLRFTGQAWGLVARYICTFAEHVDVSEARQPVAPRGELRSELVSVGLSV